MQNTPVGLLRLKVIGRIIIMVRVNLAWSFSHLRTYAFYTFPLVTSVAVAAAAIQQFIGCGAVFCAVTQCCPRMGEVR